MRLTVIPSDNAIYMDGFAYSDIDMSWVPNIDGKKVHALQWYEDHGEIEFVGPWPNLEITSLDVFEKAVDLWNERKEEDDILRQKRLEEEERIKKEEELRTAQYIELAKPEPDDEDEDLFYDIEELLKEI